jgi:hypothetical protein
MAIFSHPRRVGMPTCTSHGTPHRLYQPERKKARFELEPGSPETKTNYLCGTSSGTCFAGALIAACGLLPVEQ